MVPLINRSIMLLLGFPSNNISFSAFMLTEKQRWMCVCVHIDKQTKTTLKKYKDYRLGHSERRKC